MQFPRDYTFAMTPEEIRANWKNLVENGNFKYTSPKKKVYNCVAWAIGITNLHIDMLYFRDVYDLDPNTLDHSAKGYAACLSEFYGFEICDTIEYEPGFDKIALYEDGKGDFQHAARQLSNGKWTSKMGTYEDIEHDTLEAVSGAYYGKPVLYMKRPKA
jgi:hypothetical protein